MLAAEGWVLLAGDALDGIERDAKSSFDPGRVNHLVCLAGVRSVQSRKEEFTPTFDTAVAAVRGGVSAVC